MTGHRCPAPGCTMPVASSQYACREHWYALPKPLRDALWSAYNKHGAGSAPHVAAREACDRALQRMHKQPPGPLGAG